jgi:hypothetical protein
VGVPQSPIAALQESHDCRMTNRIGFLVDPVYVVKHASTVEPYGFDVGIQLNPTASPRESYGFRIGIQWSPMGHRIGTQAM